MSEMLISRDLFTTRVNSTMMSINERFTYLQKKAMPSMLTIRAKNSAQQQASAKNRRLAMQMEKRLSAMAALKLIKKSIKQRLGVPNNTPVSNIRERLSVPSRVRNTRGRLRRRQNPGRNLQRSQSVQSLQGGTLKRTASMQSLNKGTARRGRSRSRSRARAQTPSRNSRANSASRLLPRSPSVGRQPQKTKFINRQRRFSTGSFGPQRNIVGKSRSLRGGRRNSVNIKNQRLGNQGNRFPRNQRGRRNGQNRGRGNFRRLNSQENSNSSRRNQQFRGRRGRGGNRRGAGGRTTRGGVQIKVTLPTKEELDKQLEQYMANTKSHLDREIDTYMKESGANNL